jgi:hypothetical protein
MAKLISDFFCVGTAGLTLDGRELVSSWLTEAASEYNMDFYAARIWYEHIRVFGALGDVFAVRTQEENGIIKIYNRIVPSPELVNLKRNGQKLYSSVEIHPKLKRTGKAYQIGLGITDSPASFGTDRMEFAIRHLEKDSIFTASMEVPDLDFQTERTLFDFGRLFGKTPTATGTTEVNPPPTNELPIEVNDMTPEEYKATRAEIFKAEKAELAEILAQQNKELSALFEAKIVELKQFAKANHDALIEFATPPHGNPHQDHKPHGGGDPDKKKFTC